MVPSPTLMSGCALTAAITAACAQWPAEYTNQTMYEESEMMICAKPEATAASRQ